MPSTDAPRRLLLAITLVVITTPLFAQNLTPEQAVERMTVADGFDVSLVAAEPLVRQPVAMDFDNRGRLWVIQYLQYPNPNGLERVTVDRYSRTRYDRVPEPPPHGPRGADRITILEDTDGDGRMDRGRDFIDGLNLATGFAFAGDGVYVLNVPYLLFYPDRNHDDVPDGDPEVCLTGFGMEDAHSVANSLTWGPDGWLYGCQGSTVTANIRGIEFQQGVWRYHPPTDRFELFCEGGGNAWGLDFDRQGRLFYSTNYGGFTMVHGVPGASFVKSFSKHGDLHHPFAYGYFDHVPHENFTGGHVTVGGVMYQEDLFPESFRGRYIAADLLGHGVYWHDVRTRGSSVQTAHGGELLLANDPWFAPTDVTVGPDGAVYVADWHDQRMAHPDPDAQWDRSNGRIYRIAPKDSSKSSAQAMDFRRSNNQQLVEILQQSSPWHVRRARQQLTSRSRGMDSAERARVIEDLRQALDASSGETEVLELLWTLHCVDGFDESTSQTMLDSPHAAVRAWAIRLVGEGLAKGSTRHSSAFLHAPPEVATRLDQLSESDRDPTVRLELAALARRLTAPQALPIIHSAVIRDDVAEDPYLGLMWWWALEPHAIEAPTEVLKRFARPAAWRSDLARETLLPRLVRRYAAAGNREAIASAVALLQAAPEAAARESLWESFLRGWDEASTSESAELAVEADAAGLSKFWRQHWRGGPKTQVLQAVGIALQDQAAIRYVADIAFDSDSSSSGRAAALQRLARDGNPKWIQPTIDLLDPQIDQAPLIAAIDLLGRFDREGIAPALIDLHRQAPAAVQTRIRDVLLGRRSLAKAWLTAVDRGDVPASATPLDQIRRVALLGDPQLDALVRRHWGRLEAATPEEKLAEVRRLNNDLRAAPGDATAGKVLFEKRCATCHQLFGQGAAVGPDLTTANRQDRQFLLVSLVDPSSVVRKEYMSVVVLTESGQVFSGMPVERNDGGLTLVDQQGQKNTIPLGEVQSVRPSDVSLMPEDLYRVFSPAELRDLFAYLQQPSASATTKTP
jgi:putative membrane-bound dehydrogenase-like protein